MTKEKYVREYLFEYLDGNFEHSRYKTDKFISYCKELYPANELSVCYRAIRRVSDQTTKYKVTSSHRQLVSTSGNPYTALYACYDFGNSIQQEFDEIIVLETKQIPLLTFEQILQNIKSAPLRHSSILARSLKEQEYLLEYRRSQFEYTVQGVYTVPIIQKLTSACDTIFSAHGVF